jgi:hypothetical protein
VLIEKVILPWWCIINLRLQKIMIQFLNKKFHGSSFHLYWCIEIERKWKQPAKRESQERERERERRRRKKLEIKNNNDTTSITFVPLSFDDFKKEKVGFLVQIKRCCLLK